MYYKLFKQARECIRSGDFAQAQSILADIRKHKLPINAQNLLDALHQQIVVLEGEINNQHLKQTYSLALLDRPNAFYGKGNYGWSALIDSLKLEIDDDDKEVNAQPIGLVSHMERYFLWDASDSVAIKNDWIGIFHNPFDIPQSYQTSLTNQNLLTSSLWLESRESCVGLVTFTELHKKQLTKYLNNTVPVYAIPVPVFQNQNLWNYQKYLKNNNKKLIQLGFFLQNLHALHEFPAVEKVDKYLLRYSEMPYFKEKQLFCEQNYLEISEDSGIDDNIKEVGFLDERYFQAWLSENVVLFDFYAFSYSNSFYNCIAKGTPFLVNRLPSIESILGDDYPLFYNCKNDIPLLLSDPNKLLQAHSQLLEIAKTSVISANDYISVLETLPIIDNAKSHHKVSVVTVVLNMPELLERTIKSVIAQNYQNLEYIIVDGGSTDATLDVIKKYEEHIDVWVSELDNGIYDAMNKGGRLASGVWVNFLNAGDTFVTDTTVSDMFADVKLEDDLVYGDTIFQNKDGEKIVKARDPEHLWQAMVFNHNALFKKRNLLLEHPFSDKYKIVADSEFIIWCYTNGKKFKNVGFPINTYESGGYADMNSVMRTVERWKVVSDYKLKPQKQINDYYFQRLLWEDSCKEYLYKNYKITL